MGPIELLYDYLEDHVRAAALVNERKPLAFGVFCFLCGGLSLFVAQGLANRLTLLSFSYSSCAIVLMWKVAAGFLLTAVVHSIAEMSGSTGSASSLFVLFGMADLSWALAIPLILLSRAFGGASMSSTGIFFLIGLLSLSLKARSLQDNYHISSGRAWVTLGLPYVALGVAALLAVSLAVVGLVVELVKAFH
jgi:hypothetical protein